MSHQDDLALVEELFKKLARVHVTEVPVKKNNFWAFTAFDKIIGQVENHLDNGMREVIEQANCVTLMKSNIRDEIEWLKATILKSGSPIVFCHNDFRSSNIMVLKDRVKNNVSISSSYRYGLLINIDF